MPIYMDRHNMEGATAKAVADAHQKDLKLQEKYSAKILTYWFDEIRGSAFCLGKQFSFSDRGESTLKGFDEPLRLYAVEWEKA